MPIEGLRHTENWVTNEREGVWRKMIYTTPYNGSVPFTALTAGMKNKKVTDPKFSWWQKDERARRMAAGANLAATAGAATITVSSGAKQCRQGHVLLVEQTGEKLIVLTDPIIDTQLYVLRGFAGTTVAALTVATQNPNLFIVGSTFEEGSNAPSGVSYSPGEEYNYTQIFRNTAEITRTASQTTTRTDNNLKEALKDAYKDHITDIERAFLFGTRYQETHNTKPRRTTGGVLSYIPAANKIDTFGTAVDMDYIEDTMEKVFYKGSQEKVCFCGNRFLNILNKAIRKNSSVQLQSVEKEYGMNIRRLVTPFGVLVLKTHPEFNKSVGLYTGANPYAGYDAAGLIVDLAQCEYQYMEDTKHETKLQENDADGTKEGYITEAGLCIGNPETHFWLTGWSAAAKDS